MKPSRLRTFLICTVASVAYGFLIMLLMQYSYHSISISYIFILPFVLGVLPVLLSTKEQLRHYTTMLIPVASVMTVFFLSYVSGFEGLICLVVIVGPFVVLGALGAFIFRLIRLRTNKAQKPLYASLLLPVLFLFAESRFRTEDQFQMISTSTMIHADRQTVWNNIRNVPDIRPGEISPHFIHAIGVPKPVSGMLDRDGVGGIRSITWKGGIKFREIITNWRDGWGFSYDIDVDPASIPPGTLDEHVMIGGRYFDVVRGSYAIDSTGPNTARVTLTCTYRLTTSLNGYSRWWADLMLDDFHRMILEVVKGRCERAHLAARAH